MLDVVNDSVFHVGAKIEQRSSLILVQVVILVWNAIMMLFQTNPTFWTNMTLELYCSRPVWHPDQYGFC